ncbi:MAG: hypothetical protein CVV60_02935 [Tenericutes bacterium HGW-Tenericutes-5]|jgi:hypothetical protein|nr:MAG: hypothetical protein CVV60_02935 [Tenericutes bacterium HGW-Tenericutes-5]
MSRDLENKQNINKDLAKVLDKNRYYKIFVWSLVLVFFVLFIFSLPTLLPKLSKQLFNGEQIFAVPYQSRVEDNRIYKKIIWVVDHDEEEFYEDQLIVVYDDWTDSYWVEKIIEFNDLEKELIVTHNGTTLRIVDYEDVFGEFHRESNFLGNIYYFVSRSFGILIMGSAMFVSLGIYYFGFIRPVKKFNRKFKESYLDE